MSSITISHAVDKIVPLLQASGFKFFGRGQYNLNLFGLRKATSVSNLFDDTIVCIYRDKENDWEIERWAATTDPGRLPLTHPINSKGTAILKDGIQYRGAWKLGMHKGKYRALVQSKPITVYRDNNRDAILDHTVTEETGLFGINIHKAGKDSPTVEGWSAGCQVFKREMDFNTLICLVDQQIDTLGDTGNSISYGVLDLAKKPEFNFLAL